MTEDYIRNKVYDLEKEKLVVDSNTSKVLADIRDLLMAYIIIKLAELAVKPNVSMETYGRAKGAFIDAKKSIKKRWSE